MDAAVQGIKEEPWSDGGRGHGAKSDEQQRTLPPRRVGTTTILPIIPTAKHSRLKGGAVIYTNI